MPVAVAVWAHVGPPFLAAFMASMVEFVEALTIVLAVGTVRGWRLALSAAAAASLLLAILVIVLGPALQLVPLAVLHVGIGVLLLLFGARWLRKAVLRAAGAMPLHDEAAIFAAETRALNAMAVDSLAWMTAFKGVLIEGVEVIFIVVAIGSSGNLLVPAGVGAALAFVLVAILGVALHRPLAQVPENALKFTVGVMASSFGVFWIGEGFGFAWPGGELSLIALIAGWAMLAFGLVAMVRSDMRSVAGQAR